MAAESARTPAVEEITARLTFLREAERLKDTLRSAYTQQGRTESVAEHSWRLCLFAVAFADLLPDVDLLRVLKLCLVHDMGEAVHGDVPAPLQDPQSSKAADERTDFLTLVASLPDPVQAELVALWDEYEQAESLEARVVKALDKMETILQHNQGDNPADFDYAFNIGYGRSYTDAFEITAQIRALLDSDTKARQATARDGG